MHPPLSSFHPWNIQSVHLHGGEKDRHRDKDRNDLASPRNPSLEKVTGPPRLPGQDLGLSLDTA